MNNNISWKDALNASPGPNNVKDAAIIALKGLCMGAADIIPGVSGGTIAFITGIYEKLINAIKSVNKEFVSSILHFRFKEALSILHIRFLIPLFLGIGISVICLAGIMNRLLENEPVLTWSFFFGLILASILIIGRKIKRWLGFGGVGFLLGIIFGYLIVCLVPLETPTAWWFIILSGAIAICAMILPGISGAFILLILGKYAYITGAIKNPFEPQNVIIIILFMIGCAIGIISFSRVLGFFLKKHRNITVAILAGIMTGSLAKIWPWKEVIETRVIRDKLHVIQEKNILPDMDVSLLYALILVVLGFFVVILINRLARKK